jgi:putative ABC transport system substrate-binding protein
VSAGEIPVVRPQRFELVVNLAAARRLGITLPKGLVKRADRIVDE